MGLSRRSGQRFQANIWPGFVDAMSSLLMVMMFVLTIFMIVQYVQQQTITGQATKMDDLTANLAQLSKALGLEKAKSEKLEGEIGSLNATLSDRQSQLDSQSAMIAQLTQQRDAKQKELTAAQAKITSFEAQVASLLADRDAAQKQLSDVTTARDQLTDANEALKLAVAKARDEVNAQEEAARLAAAKREALEALVKSLQSDKAAATAQATDLQDKLTQAEKDQAAEAAAAEALRDKLKNSQDALTAMTLSLEQERKKAEDTLTLLAAAKAAEKDLNDKLAAALADKKSAQDALAKTPDEATLRKQLEAALAAKLKAEQDAKDQLTEAQRQEILLKAANDALADAKAQSADSQRKTALLNQQVAALRTQLAGLQGILDDYKARDQQAQVKIDSLGTDLNAALARAAAVEKREKERLQEEAEKLKAQNDELEKYKSDFFGKMREILAGQDGVRIVGDRFVFSSEVLFDSGDAVLSDAGKQQIDKVATILKEVGDEIPDNIDWILQVDGFTDDTPLSGRGRYQDNWELSQARSLSVVRYLIDDLGIPPTHLSANGYGQYQPIAEGDTPEARAQNRRIELKFTER